MSKHNTFFFLILPAVTRFAASNMVVTKKKWLQGSTINNDFCEKLYGVKTMRLLTYTSSPGRKKTWFGGDALFPSF